MSMGNNTPPTKLFHSMFVRCNGGLFSADVTFNFSITYRSPALFGNHVHSIVKKKRLKDEKLERQYPKVWSDFSLEVVDKTLVNMFGD